MLITSESLRGNHVKGGLQRLRRVARDDPGIQIDSGILPQVNQALTIISDLYEIAPHCIEFKRLSMENNRSNYKSLK